MFKHPVGSGDASIIWGGGKGEATNYMWEKYVKEYEKIAFLYKNCQIWANFNTFEIIWGKNFFFWGGGK